MSEKTIKNMESRRLIIIILLIAINDIFLFSFINLSNSKVSSTQNVNINTDQKEKINLNTASFEELKSLPYIGKTIAQNIIDNRPYKSVYDLNNIKGIDDKIISVIKEVAKCE